MKKKHIVIMTYKYIYWGFVAVSLMLFSCNNEKGDLDIRKDLKSILRFKSNFSPITDDSIMLDCENVSEILVDMFQRDQSVRNTGGDYSSIDSINLITFNTIIKQCGFPSPQKLKDERAKIAVFLIIQHSNADIMNYYYEDFYKFIHSGALNLEALALYEDRLLMLHNKPQIYGSQIKDGKLYRLIEYKNVDKRRNKITLDSIKVYLSKYGLSYEQEILLKVKETN